MSAPRRRDRSPKGPISPRRPAASKKREPKPVELYTPVKRLENPRNDCQEARLMSKAMFEAAFPGKTAPFPCGNAYCGHCEQEHHERIEALKDSDL